MVTLGATSVVLDLGPGAFAALLDTGRIPTAVALTHGHPDHCVDVLALFNYLRFDVPGTRGVPLLAPEGVVDRLAAFVDAAPGHDFFKVFTPAVVRSGQSVTVGDLTVAVGPAAHPVPSVSFRVTGRGHSVVYTGDTGPCPDLVSFAAGADLLLCEATFQGAPAADRYPHHLYAAEAGALAVAAGVHALMVTHVAPRLDPEVSVAEAAAVFPGAVRHAEAGLEIGL